MSKSKMLELLIKSIITFQPCQKVDHDKDEVYFSNVWKMEAYIDDPELIAALRKEIAKIYSRYGEAK